MQVLRSLARSSCWKYDCRFSVALVKPFPLMQSPLAFVQQELLSYPGVSFKERVQPGTNANTRLLGQVVIMTQFRTRLPKQAVLSNDFSIVGAARLMCGHTKFHWRPFDVTACQVWEHGRVSRKAPSASEQRDQRHVISIC